MRRSELFRVFVATLLAIALIISLSAGLIGFAGADSSNTNKQ